MITCKSVIIHVTIKYRAQIHTGCVIELYNNQIVSDVDQYVALKNIYG